MFTFIPLDVAGPGVLIAAALFSVGALIGLTLFISILESLGLYFLKWDKFSRCLLASFLMNVTSTIFGGVLIALGFIGGSFIWLAAAYLLSVLIEGGILSLMKRGATRQNWIASVVVNLASYLFIILPFILINS